LASIVINRLLRAFGGVSVAILSCSAVVAQQPQLPDAPATSVASSRVQTGGVIQSQSFSSSFSSSSSIQPRFWTSANPNAQVTVLENTLLRVITAAPLSSRSTRDGEPLLFTLDEDVVVDNFLERVS
jgi:hypothetical protein